MLFCFCSDTRHGVNYMAYVNPRAVLYHLYTSSTIYTDPYKYEEVKKFPSW